MIMADSLPIRKFIPVWIKSRQNPPRQDGKRSVSYTLEWTEYGKRNFMSLGTHATLTYARQTKADKEKELNDPERRDSLDPITFADFTKKYLDAIYPGHDLPHAERKIASTAWGKSLKSMLGEKRTMDTFSRIVMGISGRENTWCHDITSADRERYASMRITEVNSAESVDADLRNLRLTFNFMEEWKHRRKDSNPFAGRGKATVGNRRKRAKDVADDTVRNAEHYTRPQIVAILKRADQEVAEDPESWERRRLRALIYFVAYTGARIGEVLHLEWTEIDLTLGIARLNWKIEHGLKTQGSEAPVGLPDALVRILGEWMQLQRCRWVFPNANGNPWNSGGPGYKHLDQLKALSKRAEIPHATWKMFRHSMSTHGKQWFGLNKELMRIQLRHENVATQDHYDHADLVNLHASVKEIDFFDD